MDAGGQGVEIRAAVYALEVVDAHRAVIILQDDFSTPVVMPENTLPILGWASPMPVEQR